jgi:hypothetical protein
MRRRTAREKRNRENRTHFPRRVTWFDRFPYPCSRLRVLCPLFLWERAGGREATSLDRARHARGLAARTLASSEIPDALARRLAWLASEQHKSVEQVAIEQLEGLLEPATENLEEQYERFFQQSGLFVEQLAEEKQRYEAISEERLKELAAKLRGAGPLSEVIIAERDRT